MKKKNWRYYDNTTQYEHYSRYLTKNYIWENYFKDGK